MFDTIVANVDHTFLLDNIDNLKRFLKPEGNLIISGFKKNMQNNILKLYDQFFDIIDITDAMEAYWLAAKRGRVGEIYNISGEKVISVGNYLNETFLNYLINSFYFFAKRIV